jgi:hypothetical protein
VAGRSKILSSVSVTLFWLATCTLSFGLDPQPAATAPKPSVADSKPTPIPDPANASFSDIEASAVEFVRANHPELVTLLQLLKSMKEAEYEAAIREVNKVQKRLDLFKNRDKEQYVIELESWKTQSKIDLLMARAIASGKELNSTELRKLIKRQTELQQKRLRHEQNILAERQKNLKETLDKIEADAEERIEQQLATLTKCVKTKIDKEKALKAQSEPKKSRDSKAK